MTARLTARNIIIGSEVQWTTDRQHARVQKLDARGQIAVGADAVSSDWIARVDGVVGVEIRLEWYPLGGCEERRAPEISE